MAVNRRIAATAGVAAFALAGTFAAVSGSGADSSTRSKLTINPGGSATVVCAGSGGTLGWTQTNGISGMATCATTTTSTIAGTTTTAGPATTTPAPNTTTTTLPPPSAFPDANDTGVPSDVTLTPYTGPDEITVAGTVIDGKDLSGGLNIRANDVVIRNSYIRGRIDTWYGSRYTGLVVEDSTIDGSGSTNWASQAAVGNSGFTLRRVDIFGFRTGPWSQGNTTVEDSFIHDLAYLPDSHQSGLAIEGGPNNVVRHNTILCLTNGCSNAAGLYNESWSNSGGYTNQVVENNYFRGGSYMFYGGCPSGASYPCPTSVRVAGNTFYRGPDAPKGGQYGPVAFWSFSGGNTWSGNVWSDDGSPVTP